MKLQGLFKGIDISASALRANRKAMEIVSENIANVNTTRTKNGGPYQKQTPVYNQITGNGFNQQLNNAAMRLAVTSPGHIGEDSGSDIIAPSQSVAGVSVHSKVAGKQEYRLVYAPYHPDADQNGYVRFPKINILEEMVQLMQISRSFEASVTSMQAAKSMAKKALEI